MEIGSQAIADPKKGQKGVDVRRTGHDEGCYTFTGVGSAASSVLT